MKFFLIADADTLLTFSLAGLKGKVANTKEEAALALKEALEDREVGIVLIAERIAGKIEEDINKAVLKAETPVMRIPDIKGPLGIKRFKDIMMTLARARGI